MKIKKQNGKNRLISRFVLVGLAFLRVVVVVPEGQGLRRLRIRLQDQHSSATLLLFLPTHYGTKPGHFETSIIHFPTSEGVSEVIERASE